MAPTPRLSREQLGELLRRGDPARQDGALTSDERRAMRGLVISAAPTPVRRPRRWAPVAAGVCTVVFALVVFAVGSWRTGSWSRGDTPVVTVTLRPADGASEPVRQIHLTGRHGTRIIWVLNPAVQF
jgi:hypothetical protein